MESKVNSYEGMFLLDAGNPDFQAASDPVRGILTRYEAEILSFKPWDDRKLAYPIRGRKRGLYVLVYFKANPLKIVEIEHDCELDERVLRQQILRKDKLTQEVIDAPTPATGGVRVDATTLGPPPMEDRGFRPREGAPDMPGEIPPIDAK